MGEAKATLKVGISGVAEFQREIKGIKVNTSTDMDAMSKSVQKSINAMVAQYISAAAIITQSVKLITGGVNFNKFVEGATASFTVMMKSASAAQTEMQELYDFAVKSPLTFKETVTASKQLMAYGFAVKDLIPTMEMLGTVSMATGHSLEDISYVYGTLKSQGRVYTRDLMQFGMRGIPIYEELAKVLNVPVNKIQKMTQAGKVQFADVEQAFKNMTSEGGRYYGMMEQYMTTLQGKTSMLSDIWQQSLGKFTTGITSGMKTLVDNLTTILSSDNFQSYIAGLSSVLGNLMSVAGSLITFIASHMGVLTALLSVVIGLKILNSIPAVLLNIGMALSRIQFGVVLAGLKDSITYIQLIIDTMKALMVSFTAYVAANSLFVAAIVAITTVVIAGTFAFQQYKKELDAITKAAKDKQKSLAEENKQMKTASSSYVGLTDTITAYVKGISDSALSQGDISDQIVDITSKYDALKKKLSNTKNYSIIDLMFGGTYKKDTKQLQDYSVQLQQLQKDKADLSNSGSVELLSNPNMGGWYKVIDSWATKLGVAKDDVAQVLLDMGKISTFVAAQEGFVPKVSTKGYGAELNDFSRIFASVSMQSTQMSSDQIDAMFKNVNEKISFSVTDIKSAFTQLDALNSGLASDFSDMLSSSGIKVNNLTDSMAKSFTNMFNDPDSKMSAYFDYMDARSKETSVDALQSLASTNPRIAASLSDEIKKVVNENVSIYQKALLDLTTQLKQADPTMSNADLQANELYKMYEQRMIYWLKQLPEKTKKPAKEIADKFYNDVAAYFDDWKIKLTITGIDDLQKEFRDALQSVYSNVSSKLTAYQNASSKYKSASVDYSNVKGKGGETESNAQTSLNNAAKQLIIASADIQAIAVQTKQSVPEIVAYYNRQIDNLHFSELSNGVSSFWTDFEGGAYRDLADGIAEITAPSKTFGSVMGGVNKALLGFGKTLAATILSGTELGNIISAIGSTTGQSEANSAELTQQTSDILSKTSGALGTIDSYFSSDNSGESQISSVSTEISTMTTAATNTFNAITNYFNSKSSAAVGTGSTGSTGSSVISTIGNIATSSAANSASSALSSLSSSASTTSTSMSGTSSAAGGLIAVIIQLAQAFATVLSENVPSVKKVLNLFNTIAEAAEPMLAEISDIVSSPIVEALQSLGDALGALLNSALSGLLAFDPVFQSVMIALKLISALLQLFAEGLNWIYDTIIVPVGNKVINIMNAVIRLINKIPGVSIKYIDSLKTSTEILDDANYSLDSAKSALSDTISYLTDEINDAVDDQISSLKDLYENGAMSATEYQKEVKALNVEKVDSTDALVSDADKGLTSMTSIYERLYQLYSLQDAIENDDDLTSDEEEALLKQYGISGESSQTAMMTVIQKALGAYESVDSDTLTSTLKSFALSYLSDGSVDTTSDDDDGSDVNWWKVAGGVATGGVSTAIDAIGSALGWWDTGSTNIAKDQIGMVHKGEAVVPKTFMDGIRAGDLALTGTDAASSGDTYISLTVNGSVTSESDLADTIATRIYKMRAKGTATV